MIFFGVFATCAGLEIALRISSVVIWNPEKRHINIEKQVYNILCVGDSFTYGLGTSRGEAYPAYLQRILDQRLGKGSARVYNCGIPGQNSSQARDRFISQLDDIKPKAVVILIGHNNFWNYNNLHLEGTQARWNLRAERIIGRFKTYQLFKIIVSGLINRVFSGAKTTDTDLNAYHGFQELKQRKDKERREARIYESHILKHPRDIYSYLKLAEIYKGTGQVNRGLELTARARSIDPLGFEQLIKRQRTIEAFHEGQNGKRQSDSYSLTGEESFRNLYLEILTRIRASNTARTFKSYFYCQEKILKEVLRKDLAWMCEAAGRKNIKIIISSYPIDKKANSILKEISDNLGLPFVDQVPLFQRLVGNGSYGDYFALDGHCNESGNEQVAENIAKVIQGLMEKTD